MSDSTNRDQVAPAHYNDLSIMPTQVIRAAFGDEGAQHFAIGNAIKYLMRATKKGGVVDIQKAGWYCVYAATLDEATAHAAVGDIEPNMTGLFTPRDAIPRGWPFEPVAIDPDKEREVNGH